MNVFKPEAREYYSLEKIWKDQNYKMEKLVTVRMKIDIISLGKFKNNQPLKDVFEYYRKRIDLKVNLLELKTHKHEQKKSNI